MVTVSVTDSGLTSDSATASLATFSLKTSLYNSGISGKGLASANSKAALISTSISASIFWRSSGSTSSAKRFTWSFLIQGSASSFVR